MPLPSNTATFVHMGRTYYLTGKVLDIACALSESTRDVNDLQFGKIIIQVGTGKCEIDIQKRIAQKKFT